MPPNPPPHKHCVDDTERNRCSLGRKDVLEAVKPRQLSTGDVAASRESGAEHETNENEERKDHGSESRNLGGQRRQQTV